MSMIETKLPDIVRALDLKGDPAEIRVVVAMSGGVDSSVAAALVKRAGFDAVGITLQLYDHGAAIRQKGACCAGQDIHDARRVAAQLDMPHYVLDYESRFSDAVIDDFADSYMRGETPVPCIQCNQSVKFKDLLSMAKDLGAAALVTGHYISSRTGEGNRRHLYSACEAGRDQSYFLFATTQDQLDFLRFPLGEMKKDDVRLMAAELGLEVADKPDSQDICFVPGGDYASVIEAMRPQAAVPGDIVHVDGRILGQHEGILHYTIGQRRGLNVSLGAPLYVVRLEPEAHRVIVGPKEALETREITLRDVNWLGDVALTSLPQEGYDIYVKVRSTRPQQEAMLKRGEDALVVELIAGDFGVSPGQACVFYDRAGEGARVLGGGWIAGTEHTATTSSSSVHTVFDARDSANV